MRTLLLCPELFAHEGGIQRILRLYLKALCDDGDEVHLLVLNDSGFLGSEIERYSNDRLVTKQACGGSKWKFVRSAVRMGGHVDRIISGHIGQLPACWLARRGHPALDYFLVAHGIEVWRPYGPVERRALRAAKRILCVSEFTRGEMRSHISLPEERFVVVPNALDPFFAAPRGSSARTRASGEILTVSRLNAVDRYKGVEDLVRAMPLVRQQMPNARLRIVGTGDDRSRLERVARELGVPEGVTFLGFLDDDALRDAYAGCSLFALPSQKEGFGIVYLEAMAHGTPCLGARAGAVPEVIDEASGVLVEYGDVGQIANGLLGALHREWDARSVVARAQHFSYPRFRVRLGEALAA